MNYRDYMEIFEAEGLKRTRLADFHLEKAGWCHRVATKLKEYDGMDEQIKRLEEKKIGHILEAIEWGRWARDNSDLAAWADRQYQKMEEYK